MKSDVAMLFAAKEHKIVVVGPRKVGKSALVVRFLTKRFICEYVENTDMPCQRETEVDGEQLKVHIQDTSDKGMTIASIEHYLRWADAIMMIYSITDADGFTQLKSTATTIIEKISDLKEKEQRSMPPLVLVGNKGDLELVRKVSRLEGLELAEKLRCEFFEASAREGWSKLLCSNMTSPPVPFYPSSDTDTSTPASPPISNITPITSPRDSPLRLPSSPKRGKSLNLSKIGEDHVISQENFTPRWSSFTNSRQVRRCGRSYSMTGPSPELTFSTVPQINVPNTIPRLHSYPSSPICVQEETDNSKKSKLLSPAKLSKPNGGFIGKLSPRLGRRFSKANKTEESQKQSSKNNRDDNNNKQNKRPKQNKMSVSLTSIPRETELQEYKRFNFNNISENGCTSRAGSASSCGSTESLVLNGQDLEIRLTDSPLFVSPPLSPKLCIVNQIQEQDFASSEPFLFLCRVRPLQRTRSRSRSPSHRIISGLKKIRSLGGDNSQGPNSTKQQPNGGLLVVPSYKV